MSNNNIYNILGKLKSITDTAALTPDTQPTTVYESVEARGSITEAVKALEAEYKTFKESKPSAGLSKAKKSAVVKKAKAGKDIGKPGKGFEKIEKAAKKGGAKDPKAVAAAAMWKNIPREEELDESVADDIADRKAEKEAGDWWGAKKDDKKGKREVKGSKYGGSKQKDDDDDFKSKKTAILDKDDEEDLDEGIVDAIGSRIGHAVKGAKRALAGKSSAKQVQQQHAVKARAGQVNLGSTAQQIAAAPGEEKKAERTGKVLRNVAAQQAGYKNDIDEAFEFGSKGFKNAANLKKASKTKLVKESAVRNHPIYTNPEAWDHYKKELDEEELNKATQELEEIANLAGLPKQINVDMNKGMGTPAKPDGVTLPPAPIEQEPMLEMDDEWDDESGYDLDDPKHPTWAERQREKAEWARDYARDNELDEAEVEEGNEFSGALAAAKASGKKDFEVDGKRYTVKEDINVNVTASGEEDALNLFRKLAGMPMVAIAQQEETPCDGAMEIEVDEERDPEYLNSPREQIAPVSAAIPSGTDLNRSKRQYKKEYPGDNPMAVAEAKDTSWSKYASMLKGLLK